MPVLGWDLLSSETKRSILRGMETGEVYNAPRSAQVDWTDRCNAGCFFCSQAEVRKGGDELSVAELDRIFAELDRLGIPTIEVSGGGDPLFHRQIREVLDTLSDRNVRIGCITTNGVLLAGDIAERLVRLTRSQITVSINTCEPDSYGVLMGLPGRLFHQVVDNVKNFISLRRSQGAARPRIALQFLVYDENFRLLPKMFALARELEVDRMVVNPLHIPGDLHRRILLEQESFLEDVEHILREDRDELIGDILTIHPALNKRIRAVRAAVAPNRYKKLELIYRNLHSMNSYCAIPWFHAHITARGSVYPCCALTNQGFSPLGDIREQTLEQIWHSDHYQKFRSAHAAWPEAGRHGADDSEQKAALPKPCTDFGECFLRALPYIDDTAFAIEVDRLGRLGGSRANTIPSPLQKGVKESITGVVPGGPQGDRAPITLCVNDRPGLKADIAGGRYRFEFFPDPLEPGLHLLEVKDAGGEVLAARVVEMLDR